MDLVVNQEAKNSYHVSGRKLEKSFALTMNPKYERAHGLYHKFTEKVVFSLNEHNFFKQVKEFQAT